MKAIRSALAAASLSVAMNAATAAGPPSCPLSKIEGQRELHEFLSLRAIEVVKLARSADRKRLAGLVAPSAAFSLGAGDVGRPLGTGVQGAEALADTMRADTYRYLGWDYMDGPAEPCSSQKVTVEFLDNQSKSVSEVEFTFMDGRLTNASGWERSFESGSMKAARASH